MCITVSFRKAVARVRTELNKESGPLEVTGGLLIGSAAAVAALRPAFDLISALLRQPTAQKPLVDGALLGIDIIAMAAGLKLVKRANEAQKALPKTAALERKHV